MEKKGGVIEAEHRANTAGKRKRAAGFQKALEKRSRSNSGKSSKRQYGPAMERALQFFNSYLQGVEQMIKSMVMVLTSAVLAVSLPASAHTDEYFDTHAAPHSGQVRMAGPYHLELVTKDKELTVYVTDHADAQIKTEGGVGKASFQVGKAKPKTSIKLEPAGDNVMKGKGDFSLTPDTVVIVFVKLPEQEAQSARFTPLKAVAKDSQKKGDKKADEGHGDHASHGNHDSFSRHGKHDAHGQSENQGGGDNHHMHH